MKRYFLITFLSFLFSCEDIITPDLPVNEPIVVVDGWINILEIDEVIKLSETQNIFGKEWITEEDRSRSFLNEFNKTKF